MKLRKAIQEKITPKLIIRINELYHDYENSNYNLRYKHLFAQETERWKALATRYIWSPEPKKVVDFGTGTGFVAKIIAPKLSTADHLSVMDVSNEMLQICENELIAMKVKCNFSAVQVRTSQIPALQNNTDILALNAVLHHLPDINIFAEEANRILKPGGKLIIVHEPNADTKLPVPHRWLLALLKKLTNFYWLMNNLVEHFEWLELLLRKVLNKFSPIYKHRNEFLAKISEQLIAENLINIKLRGVEIQQLVDIQTENGFSKELILKTFEPYFDCVEFKTFNYIALRNNALENRLNNYYSKNFPDKGATFYAVFSKKQ